MFEGTKGFLVYSTPNHYWPVLGWYVDLTMVDWNSLMINQPKSKRKIWVWVEIFGPIDKPVQDMLKWLRSSQLMSTVHNQQYATKKYWLKWLWRKKDWHAFTPHIYLSNWIAMWYQYVNLVFRTWLGMYLSFLFLFSCHTDPLNYLYD